MQDIYLNLNSGYVFNEETKKLEYFTYEKAVFNFESGKVSYHGKLGGVDAEIIASERYKDEESFKRGMTFGSKQTIRLDEVQRRGLRYIFKDGKALPIPNNYDYEIGTTYWSVKLANGKRAYASMEEAYDFNDFIVKENDGTERVVKCAASKVALTDEQRLFIKQFNDLVAGMEQYGIGFIYDQRDGMVKIINNNLIEKIEFDCDRYSDEGWSDIKNMYEGTDLKCSYTHEDEYINAKFKE